VIGIEVNDLIPRAQAIPSKRTRVVPGLGRAASSVILQRECSNIHQQLCHSIRIKHGSILHLLLKVFVCEEAGVVEGAEFQGLVTEREVCSLLCLWTAELSDGFEKRAFLSSPSY
jgi:hypothetical protein